MDAAEPLWIAKLPKPVSEMTEAELDAWCDRVIEATPLEPNS
jgi:hypothetical protein